MAYPTQADFQNMAATGGAQAVFNYAKNNGMSLDQLAKIGGVSTQDMANLAQANGINTGMLSQIGYTSPPTTTATQSTSYTGNATDKPIYNPLTGSVMQPGTKDYNDYVTSNMAELKATGYDPTQFAASGGRGPTMAQQMNLYSPLSSAYAAHNVDGGGSNWYASIGGNQGYLNGMMTDPNYLSKILDPGTAAIYQEQNGVANKLPVYDPTTGTYRQNTGNGINSAFVYSGNMAGNALQGSTNNYYKALPYQVNNNQWGNQNWWNQGINQPTAPVQQWYNNYGNQGMFGGTASPGSSYKTSYTQYNPYGGNYNSTGMFGAPVNMKNMQQNPYTVSGNSWSQVNPWSY